MGFIKETLKQTIKTVKSFVSHSATKYAATLAFVLGIYCVGAHADIVSFDQATNKISWDFSTIMQGMVTALAAGMGIGGMIFLIVAGWHGAKKLFK